MRPIKPISKINPIARDMLMNRQSKKVIQSKKLYNRKKSNDSYRKENTTNGR